MDSTTGESRQQRLCRTIHKDLIAKLKATKERAAHMKERVALTTKADKAKKAMRAKNSRSKKAKAQKNDTS